MKEFIISNASLSSTPAKINNQKNHMETHQLASFLPFSTSLPSYVFFLCLFYNDKTSWSFIWNANSLSVKSYNIHWNFQPGMKSMEKPYVLTERHMEIWYLDTFSQQHSFHQRIVTLSYWQSCTWWTGKRKRKRKKGRGREEGREKKLNQSLF